MEDEFLAPPPPLANTQAGVESVDTANCSVLAVICTAAKDSLGDIIVPTGCDLSSHRANPTVYYHHGIGIGGSDSPGYILPVGKAETEDGAYGVIVHPEREVMYATTKFSQTTKFARDVFALYTEGILRGFSVNARPVEWERIDDMTFPGGASKKCFRHTRWTMSEYSATGKPVNLEALTISVQSGKLAGETMNPVLRAHLSPYCLPAAAQSVGVTIATGVLPAHVKPDTTPAVDGLIATIKPDAHSVLKAQTTMPDTEKKPDEERPDPNESGEKKPEPEGEEKKAEEETPLKAGPKGMVDALQTLRDHRSENAKRHNATEDEGAMAAHEDIDAHLAKAEEIAHGYLEEKGHKVEGYKPSTFEDMKSSCVKADEEKKPECEEREQMKAAGYKPPRFHSVMRAETKKEPQMSSAELRILNREVKELSKRLAGKR